VTVAVGAADRVLGRFGRPREEAVVGPGDARAYEVATGDYVQIVDVRGCQVSDFLAFRSDRRETGISNAVTRALVDGLFPLPGQSFHDADGEPLLELVEDTVGRHDTFGLACNREYYEALGLTDHRNCTDNFNRELAAFGFAPRRFWEPVNFFFNTRIGPDGRTVEVEPALSKPGDYVLMRADVDLVVASSACPDDVLPTNGFDPTEVMVRVFPPSPA
jgi:glycine cleavage system T protein (aminomethyltransferase)